MEAPALQEIIFNFNDLVELVLLCGLGARLTRLSLVGRTVILWLTFFDL